MVAVAVATTLVSEATSKMESSVTGRAVGSYVSNPNGIYLSSVLDISAATAPGNILSLTESRRTESTSALSRSDRLSAFITSSPAPRFGPHRCAFLDLNANLLVVRSPNPTGHTRLCDRSQEVQGRYVRQPARHVCYGFLQSRDTKAIFMRYCWLSPQ